MEVQIIAIGEQSVIEPIFKEYIFTNENNVFVASVPRNLTKYVTNTLKARGAFAMEYAKYLEAISSVAPYDEISEISNNQRFGWYNTGSEYFYTLSGASFEMQSIDKKNVKLESKQENVMSKCISADGSIIGFVFNNTVKFTVGNSLQLIFDITFDCVVDKVMISDNNSFAIVSTKEKLYVYNIFKGSRTYEFDLEPFTCLENKLNLLRSQKIVDLCLEINELSNRITNLQINNEESIYTAVHKGVKACFYDGKMQKITYGTTSKILTHVKKVNFFFGDQRLFALMVKSPGKEEHYVLDTILNKEVTSMTFDHEVLSLAVADNFFVVQLSNFEVKFYNKDKYNFTLVNTIKKDGPAVLSISGFISCIYDSSSNSIEFYDKGGIRSVFSHPGCTNISWSKSGLYVATYSFSSVAGCLVQIFNVNGQLMFKKIYNSLKEFGWRSYPEASVAEVEKIIAEHSIDEIEEEQEEDVAKVQALLKEWKEYLLTKVK